MAEVFDESGEEHIARKLKVKYLMLATLVVLVSGVMWVQYYLMVWQWQRNEDALIDFLTNNVNSGNEHLPTVHLNINFTMIR